jgi:hypothetical protein
MTTLLNATARRYGVEASDLYTPTQIAEELVKEVMDSSFISSPQKGEYCSRLADLGVTAQKETSEPAKEPQPQAIAEYRQRLTSSVSMLLGLLTGSMTVMFSLLELVRSRKSNLDSVADLKNLEFFIPVLAATTTMAVTILFFGFYRDFLRRRRSATEEKTLDELRAERKAARQIKPKPTPD